jgi:hypothetical protein
MRRPLALALLALAFPSAAVAGAWSGSWADDGTGTHGGATLTAKGALRLAAPALGCAQPVVLAVRYRGGRLSGSGRDLACSHGLRWRVSGPAGAAVLHVRLADGTRASLRLALHRRQ